jgi:hypothetical protein
MINSLLIGVGGVILLVLIWIVVQQLWRKVFAEYISEPDVLAERSSCGNCTCTTACTKPKLK